MIIALTMTIGRVVANGAKNMNMVCQGDKTKCDFYPSTDVRPITTSVAHYTLDLGSGTIRAKPIITNYDLLISKTPDELAKTIVGWLADAAELCGENRQEFDFTKAEEYAVSWLKSPVEEGEE